MLGECDALKTESEGIHIDAIRANHSKFGITSLKLALNGIAGSFGADAADDEEQTITDWVLEEGQEFVGF